MALTSDSFIERAYLKRQVSFWRLVTIGVIVFCVIMFFERNVALPEAEPASYIARISIQGTMMDNDKLYELLDKVEKDDAAKAVILHLDSPGGAAVAGETIFNKIQAIREKKPVVSAMRSVCASACYMVSLASDHILAMRGTLTGSIGVIFQTAQFAELANKIGVQPIIIKSGPFKGSPSMHRPINESERAILQQMIDEFHQVFISMVAEARDMPEAQAATLSDGRIYSAMRAKELTLIDDLGGEMEALDWLAEHREIDPELTIKDLEIKSKFDKFMEQLEQRSGFAYMSQQTNPNPGLMLLWSPGLSY